MRKKRAPASSPDTVGGRIALSRTFVAPVSKNDDELNEFIDEVTDGTYNLPCVEVIFKLVNQM